MASDKGLGMFHGPHGEHLIDLAANSVTVIFDGTGYTFSRSGPTIESARDRAVVRVLLSAAIDVLDAS